MTDKISQNTNRKNLLQLIFLRLIASCGQIITILVVNFLFEIALPLTEMFLVIVVLNLINAFSFYRYKTQKIISNNTLFIELLFDVIALTIQLYLSGGAANPFISLFLLQVIIASVLLQRIYATLIALITIICYVFLVFYHHEFHAFHHHNAAGFFNLHLNGMLISYILSAILLLIFVTKIIANLQERDRKSQEEEQIIRMGLMASNAAHELSTPLTTISVTLNDLKNLELLSSQEIKADLELMDSQINRCKKILSEILLTNNQMRSEKAQEKLVKEIFDDMIAKWAKSRKTQNFSYNFLGDNNKKIIFDDILVQAFFNIFDNALQAAQNMVEINVKSSEKEVIITVKDDGKGFDKKVLKQLGKVNITTKNSTGVGLFLSINILTRFNAKIKVSNLTKSKEIIGAVIEITIV